MVYNTDICILLKPAMPGLLLSYSLKHSVLSIASRMIYGIVMKKFIYIDEDYLYFDHKNCQA